MKSSCKNRLVAHADPHSCSLARVIQTLSSKMHIRPLIHSDASDYRALMLQGYEIAADAFTSTAPERAAEPLSWWRSRIENPHNLSHVVGAFHEGILVGTVTIEYSARSKILHKAHLIGMYVSDLHRGLGAGKALLKAAIAHARTRAEVKVLTLTVTHGNKNAIHLYESLGFHQFGLEPMAIFTGTEYKAKVHMQRDLSLGALTDL